MNCSCRTIAANLPTIQTFPTNFISDLHGRLGEVMQSSAGGQTYSTAMHVVAADPNDQSSPGLFLSSTSIDEGDDDAIGLLGTALAIGSQLIPLGIKLGTKLVQKIANDDAAGPASAPTLDAEVSLELFDPALPPVPVKSPFAFTVTPETVVANMRAAQPTLTVNAAPGSTLAGIDIPCVLQHGGLSIMDALVRSLPALSGGPKAYLRDVMGSAAPTAISIVQQVINNCVK